MFDMTKRRNTRYNRKRFIEIYIWMLGKGSARDSLSIGVCINI